MLHGKIALRNKKQLINYHCSHLETSILISTFKTFREKNISNIFKKILFEAFFQTFQ